MGAAYFIVLERKIEGLDTMMSGKSISHHIDVLDSAARELRVKPLSEFFSIAPDDAADFMEGEGVDPSEIKLPPLQQFPAQDGLATARALAGHAASKAEGLMQDLNECERILSAAAQHGVGWHFEVDF